MSDEQEVEHYAAGAAYYRQAYIAEEARRCEAEVQLAEALSQRQAAVEEAERLREERDAAIAEPQRAWADAYHGLLEVVMDTRRELAAANQAAANLAGGLAEMLNQYGDEGHEVGWQKRMHECVRSLLATHSVRLASQPPAEAEGAS